MLTKEKIAYINRLDLAKEIVTNIKNDFKIMIDRSKAANNEQEQLLNTFLASSAIDVALAINKFQVTIIEAEKELAEYLSKKGE